MGRCSTGIPNAFAALQCPFMMLWTAPLSGKGGHLAINALCAL